ncbi:phosphatase PAP2 family protein [Clostridium tagluense]|uniref:Phosphatase PAP2 family protein n=1 Tax=Clostridium tagluense TaxID=360422 RepID=A0A401UI49_9CLOT|nr:MULTISPECIES: phosphatase PAP2 family protein [Clostridium]MBU3129155.1 phosphatase PAP2 family protein [Clostridium tagluense]MBW9156233.1 phosphatase PAP2 family protein [Clostridium tagluense]MBZ9625777.1 phosphatase PAP2 family protein [Clostridium sp. FP2]MCB2298027.1 phosphatase PAP2 family protein [Clostridium tagluense]MCB2311372.1 phosphatase PAP2 family protein [Clostridium tagluense]
MKALFEYISHRDINILRIINNSWKCKFLDIVMPAMTYLGSFTFMFIFCTFAFLLSNALLHVMAIRAMVSITISTGIGKLLKISVTRLRPFIDIPNLNIKKIGIDKYSFPSGHTTGAFSLAVIVALYFPIFGFISIPLACCVGISRMYIGVHYPTDVIVGAFLGITCSFLTYRFF